MIRGVFEGDIPLIGVVVAWGQSVQELFVILDTGFTGDVQVTPRIAQDLGLEVVGVTRTRYASGETVEVPVALARATMEGVLSYIQVQISGGFPLVGISFLTKFGYKAIVDCKNRTVILERE